MSTNPIPYGRQNITEDDIQKVTEALKSDFLTQGPRIAEFEKEFARYIGAEFAIAVSSGTSALHLCAMALDVQPGDKVITSPITFAASANCVRYCGGEVVFADIDPETRLIDVNKVRTLLEASPKGTYKGIIPVDFEGRPVLMEQFRQLADEHGLWLIEDACHAPGGYYVDSSEAVQNCGGGTYADLAIFSFHPVKHIAAGEGGMITTNDASYDQRIRTLRTHGIVKDDSRYDNSKGMAFGHEGQHDNYPGWYMEMQELGYNYRITDIQAALGSSQLSRAHEGIARRRELAKKYEQAFNGLSFLKGQSGFVEGHAYHLYVLEVENRAGLYQHLRDHKIFAQIHYIPVHLMPYYQARGWSKGDFPNAEAYYEHCISLPMYPTLSDEEQQFVIETIISFYNEH